MTYEGFRLKILKYYRKGLAKYRRKRLKRHDFSIISNNCWGGMIYESYGLLKQSPTVGCFFMSKDFIKFVSRLKEYLETELYFIKPEESIWHKEKELLKDKRFGTYPIGRLTLKDKESIEIFFLHYHTEEEAKEKWERRCARVNWEKILIKFNDQNGCDENDVDNFIKLPYKKLFFTCRKWEHMDEDCIVIKQLSKYHTILSSYEPFGRSKYIDITRKINEI